MEMKDNEHDDRFWMTDGVIYVTPFFSVFHFICQSCGEISQTFLHV